MADIGSIGSFLDAQKESGSMLLLYSILWKILSELKRAIQRKQEERNFPFLEISFPSDRDFYSHPTPILYFKDILYEYHHLTRKKDRWKDTKVLVLMDEFSYIFGEIVQKRIPDTFMKNWKALLEANFFSVVVVGQDVMMKFIEAFPNELAISEPQRVTYLSKEDAIKLIDKPIRIGGKSGETRYREKAIEKIINLSACNPYYIQIICQRLVDYMNDKHSPLVTDADIERVKENLIRGSNPLTVGEFDNLYDSGDVSDDAIKKEDALNVLTEIAKNTQQAIDSYCSFNSINCSTEKDINEIVSDLLSRDVLEHNGNSYRIKVGLFREWLIFHQRGIVI